MKTIVYGNWKTQSGKTREVELINFLQYFRTTNGEVLVFTENDVDYIGEVWLAKHEGKNTRCIIRVEEDTFGESSNNNSIELIDDNLPNPLVDDIETVMNFINGGSSSYLNRNKRKVPNQQLEYEEEKDKIKNIKLRKLHEEAKQPDLKYALRCLLEVRQSPSLRSVKKWKAIDQDYKTIIQNLVNAI